MAHQRGDFYCVVGDWSGILLDTVCPVMTNAMLRPSLEEEEEEEQESKDRPDSTEQHEERQGAVQSLSDRNEITSATPLPSPMFDVPSTPMATPTAEVESPVQRPRPSPKLSPSLPTLIPEAQPRADFQLPSSVTVRREFWGEMDADAAQVPTGYEKPGGELHRLLRSPDFHDFHELLLAGLGLAGKSSESRLGSPESPFWRRCRLLWQSLRPAPLKPESLTESVQPSPCDPLKPPNWARYTAGSDQIRLRSSAETRREVYSFCAQPLWGRLLRPARPKGTTAVPSQVRLPVTAKHWSGRSAPTVAELSLLGDQPFVLYEYVEEFPPLLLNVGMSHRVGSYYMQHSSRSYDGQALGPLACLHPVAVKDGTLPGMSARLNPGQGMSIMDSLLQKAPLFRHSLENKFLLVQSRGLSASWELSLRSLETCCLVGQIEPKKQVPSPWSKDFALLNNECIRHMYLEAKRKWQRESSGDVAEDVEKTLFDEIAESVFQWWPEAKSARAELKGGGQGQQPAKSLSELVCLLDAARRGQERLQRLGIDLLTDDKKVQKALQELEKLEKHRDRSGKRGESDLAFCARWVLEQLQLTPWHLTMQWLNERNAAERGEKGASRNLAVVGPGDPSARLEGVSYLPVGAKELAECIELATLQRLSDAELRKKLLASFPEAMFRSLGRWDRISLLCRSLGDAETTGGVTVTGWSGVSLAPKKEQKPSKDVKQKHASLLQEAFDRQAAALSEPIQDMSEGEIEQKEVGQELLDEQDWLEALAEGSTSAGPSAGAASAIEMAPALFETRSSRADTDQAELQKMRQRLGISQPEPSAPRAPTAAPAATDTPAFREATQVSQNKPEEAAPPQSKPKDVEPEHSSVKVLKVVTLHKSARGFKEKVMYVVGEENIQLYRELHTQEAPRMLSTQEPRTGSKQKTRTLSGVSAENDSDGDSGDARSRPGPRSSLSAGNAKSRGSEQRESKRRKTSISGAPSDAPHSTSEKSDSLLSSQALDPQSDRVKKRLRLA